MTNSVPYGDVKERLLANSEVRAAYDALDPAYQVACLRIAAGMTQAELAEKVGTRQPNIARLEAGKHIPTLGFLQRVARALGYRLDVRFVREDAAASQARADSQATRVP
jgi:predicted transcriptional regulator